MSKKIKDNFFDKPYTVLTSLCYVSSLGLLSKDTGIPKQNLTYWLNKLIDEGFVERLGKGSYCLTVSGKRIYDQYNDYKNKQLVRIENMRVTFVVEEGGDKLETSNAFKINPMKNGTRIYHAHFDDRFTRLIVSKKIHKIEVTITNVLDIHYNDAYHQAILEAYKVAQYICETFNVELSDGKVTTKPEIAIPSPISSALLNTTGASQIRTNKGVMNRSKGRGADWEVYTLQEAQRIVNMPNTLDKIQEKLCSLENHLKSTISGNYHDLAGNSSLIYAQNGDYFV